MSLTLADITSAKSDEELFKLLSTELNRRVPESVHENRDKLAHAIQQLPPGLRAMAATHWLDVSMALDDLGWHFHNFYHNELCDETARGLCELEATEVAEIFEHARREFETRRQQTLQSGQESLRDFPSWYESSGLEAALAPLNKRLWEICSKSPDYGLMQLWLDYARKHPEKLFEKK